MIVAIVLAAGLSRRFPGNKLLFTWEGKPVIRWTVENILDSNVDHVVVVLGHDHQRVKDALKGLDNIEYIFNEEYMKGMSSSVRKGVQYVQKQYGDGLEAVIFAPGDTAWAPPDAYNIIIEAFRETGKKIVVASYNKRRGHPILFSKELVPELLNVSEETKGLKGVIRRHYLDILVVDTPYPGVVLDLDTYNDLNRVKYMLKK